MIAVSLGHSGKNIHLCQREIANFKILIRKTLKCEFLVDDACALKRSGMFGKSEKSCLYKIPQTSAGSHRRNRLRDFASGVSAQKRFDMSERVKTGGQKQKDRPFKD